MPLSLSYYSWYRELRGGHWELWVCKGMSGWKPRWKRVKTCVCVRLAAESTRKPPFHPRGEGWRRCEEFL